MKHTKKRLLFCIFLICILAVTGCTSEQEYNEYLQAVTQFDHTVRISTSNLNQIDASAEDAASLMLAEFDALNEAFQVFSEVKVPNEFADAGTLAKDGASYMSEANELYHTALESDSYDAFSLSLANEKYTQAVLRVQAIGDVLQGKEISEELLIK